MDYVLKSKTLILDSGERVVLLIDPKSQIPNLQLNRYLFGIRKPVISFKSLKKESETISLICNHSKIFYNSLIDGELLTRLNGAEVLKLWNQLRKNSKSGHVAADTHMYRWDVFYSLVDYFTDLDIFEKSHTDPLFKLLLEKKKILVKEIKRLRYSASSKRLKGLEKNVLKYVLKVSRIDSPNNPWIERDRLRNQVIIDFLLKLGLRAGELQKISIDDLFLNTSHPYIRIHRKINEKSDPRKNEPRVKTFGRLLEIDDSLFEEIISLLKQRRQIPNAKRSKFLFVSNSNGQPLSYDRVHAILDIKVPGNEDQNITPHSLRRTWNDLFREYADKVGIDSEIVSQVQNYLQGRMLNSSESAKYSAKYIERSAREAHLEFQRNMLGEL